MSSPSVKSAVRQGKLYGLPLAVFDALLFPMLLLDGIILQVLATVTMTVLVVLGAPHYGPLWRDLMEISPMALPGIVAHGIDIHKVEGFMITFPTALAIVIGLAIIPWVDYWIVRAVWRNATGDQSPEKSAAGIPTTTVAGGGRIPAPAKEARATPGSIPAATADRALDDMVGRSVDEPQLSRCALWGAIWPLLGFLLTALAAAFFFLCFLEPSSPCS